MSEAALQSAVLELAAWYGIACYHTHDSRRSQPGYPDLTIAGSRVIWRELKSGRGRLSPAQVEWGERLQLAGCDWAVWRPADWHSGLVRAELAAIRVSGCKHQ
jgi:hypothetical protein